MTLKQKLFAGLLLLWGVMLLIGGLGTYAIIRLSDESSLIIKDNYKSLGYVQNMIGALDDAYASSDAAVMMDTLALMKAYARFDSNFTHELNNITEPGERDLVMQLYGSFNEFKTNPKNTRERYERYLRMRTILRAVFDVNMNAILRKHDYAQASARTIMIAMAAVGIPCLILTLIFVFRFPGYIVAPIRALSEGIRSIAEKKYERRVNITTKDEFGEVAASFNRMASRLEEYDNSNWARILFEKTRIETIIRNMHDPILVLDERGFVLFTNPAFSEVVAVPEKNLVGQYAPTAADQNIHLRSILNPAMNDSADDTIRLHGQSKDLIFRREQFSVIRTDDAAHTSQALGRVIILKNVTQFHELDMAKTNFMATISHELKTPLSTIDLSVKLLQDERTGVLSDEQKKLVRAIRQENSRLMKLVSELLDMTQLESGQLRLTIGRVSVMEIILLATDALEFQLHQKSIRITTGIPHDVPFVSADLDKTVWVMVNLLTNAVRYTAEGGAIRIAVRKNDQTVEFSVEDYGEGIDPKHHARIFERYIRLENPSTGDGGGTGLGLSTARDFILAQRGTIQMESVPGKGSRFYFTLPVFAEG